MKTIKDLVDSFVSKKHRSRIAITDRKEYRRFHYRYEELYDLCTRFSTFLAEKKIKKGDKILLWAPNGIEFVTALLGATSVGVVVVPIDMRSDAGFAKKIQAEVKAKLVFQTRYKPKLANAIFTEDLLNLLPEKAKHTTAKVGENEIAELIYTSGTTGEPKGIILTHKNLISNTNSLNKIEQVTGKERFLSVLPLSHIFEQQGGLFIPLSNGAYIAYIRTLKLSSLMEAFEEERPTHVNIVPRLLQLLRSGIEQSARQRGAEKKFESALRTAKKFPFLRKILFSEIHKRFGGKIDYFICGGASLDVDLEEWFNTLGLEIRQGYGLTETSPVITYNAEGKVGSIGKPIPSVQIKIEEGEILVKGDSVTQGYYKNPRRTKELFSDGWMRTGDLGEFGEGGFIYFKGRKKDLIVTSAGINVYPEDLESVLNKQAGVKDSCVIELGGKIHAVLLLEKGSAKELVEEANKHLGEGQRIQAFSTWPQEDFPRTPTMKVRKFVVKEATEKGVKPSVISKKSKLDRLISRFTTKEITPTTSLQSLGFSSIDRVELISLMEQEFNVEIDEEKVIGTTKVKELEDMIKERGEIEKKQIYQRWALSWPIRVLRGIIQPFVLRPIIVWLFTIPKVEGLENLADLRGPVIFASNHRSHYDTGVILGGLPYKFSQNLAIATWEEWFFKEDFSFVNPRRHFLFYFGAILANLYTFPKTRGYKRGMKYTGEMVDKGWNILLFPEGERTRTGRLQPFKQGIGILASEMKIPIVPLKVEGSADVLPIGKTWPKSAKTKLKIGKPIYIKKESYIEATKKIEEAVRNL